MQDRKTLPPEANPMHPLAGLRCHDFSGNASISAGDLAIVTLEGDTTVCSTTDGEIVRVPTANIVVWLPHVASFLQNGG